jgi:hypothetical protein
VLPGTQAMSSVVAWPAPGRLATPTRWVVVDDGGVQLTASCGGWSAGDSFEMNSFLPLSARPRATVLSELGLVVPREVRLSPRR